MEETWNERHETLKELKEPAVLLATILAVTLNQAGNTDE